MCDNCGLEKNEAYEMPSGDYYCLDCYQGVEASAELRYESSMEDFLNG